MKSLFTLLTRLSLRFQLLILGLVVACSALGIIAITQLKQELLPSVSFPQTIILTQASGMSSEQVLNVLTTRIETALKAVPAIINTESTTTGAFGSVVIGRNDFGQNQAKIQQQIQKALDTVWLPLRRIEPAQDENPQAFAQALLGDVTPEMLIYLQQADPNFLFQISPEVWSAFSEPTLRSLLAYLATQKDQASGNKSALNQLIEQEIIPQLDASGVIGNITVSGGQALPNENNQEIATNTRSETEETSSLIHKLSSDAWRTISTKLGITGELNTDTASTLAQEPFSIPESVPVLPASWQHDHFIDTSDLLEMRTLTQSLGGVFNNFATTGRIIGSLGQTNDLTPEILRNMLELDPTLVQYFKADQLAAMSPEVFAALPDDYISGLDGLTRDELAAKALAQGLTGENVAATPVNLPAAWRISPPQLVSFSFDDIPLATFSVFNTADTSEIQTTQESQTSVATAVVDSSSTVPTEVPAIASQDVPEGPALPEAYGQLGLIFGRLDTADDLFSAQINPLLAAQFGEGNQLGPSGILNTIVLLDNLDLSLLGDQIPAAMKGLVENLLNGIDSKVLIGELSPEAVSFIIDHDPTFLRTLQANVYELFPDSVLKLAPVAPPLATVWNTLANRPEFAGKSLRSANDLITLGSGKASTALNQINENVPERFAGYEVRLFDSLSPATIRYFMQQERDFFTGIDVDVLKKLSPSVLQLLPTEVKASLDAETAQIIQGIADGSQESAAQQLAALYATNTPPADPEAPDLNAEWGTIGNFIGVELDTADDLFRFFPDPAGFVNSFFDTAQGANFAPGLLGKLSPEVVAYWVERDGEFVNNLRIEALQLLSPEVLSAQPQSIQDRAASGSLPFKATNTVTRTNGNSSLLLTVFKKSGMNTVEAFHIIDETMKEVDAGNDTIGTAVSFEQASFIEESIVGVVKEGGLGGIFAVVIILIFLSKGTWNTSPRRLVGVIIFGASLISLGLIVISATGNSGGDFGASFNTIDPVIRLLLILGTITGLLIFIWPGSLPYPAWRSTLVVSISIPLSLLMALALMRWLPPTVNSVIAPAAETSSILAFILRLFPASLTINIMTLSGLTVAIGRVVDDSIVVLENIFRQIQEGGDKKQAIIAGTRDVSVAIFSATVITVVVFLPLGLTGGLIGEFFLPFGLAVTYALLSSFIVAITVVPLLAYLFIGVEEANEEAHEGTLERVYVPALRWSLASNRNKLLVLLIAFISLVFGVVLFANRPTNFISGLGEPQISVKINLPVGTSILDTNEKTLAMENALNMMSTAGDLGTIQTIVGGGAAGLETLLGVGGGVSENIANITIGVKSQEKLDTLTDEIRTQAENIFGDGNVTVSAASISDQGFGGLELVLSGPEEDLETANQLVIDALNSVPGVANATSDLAATAAVGDNAPRTYIRIDGQSAISFSAELETDNTIGVTTQAINKIKELPDLPSTLKVSQGFQSDLQTQGFQSLFVAMGIAILIVIVILMVTFGSVVHWFDIILSIMVAPVGAAILLTLTDRVLGISAMIGMLMLIGIVVTNAVVLIDRVQANLRERKMSVQNALVEAGNRRLRPILMTALATVFALMPLALGFSKGAIIAAELGTVVIGGLVSSTLLTLIVVPVMYSLLAPIHKRVNGLLGRND